ncbi:MAG: IS1634 family transposase [Bacteroidia bacterium]|nr:IS1634 family transposase [Bacteroidia bacterium]
MFIKAADKKDKKTGKIYRYYKLCESYRIGEKTRHRTVLILGKLEDIVIASERKYLADRIEQLLNGAQDLFASDIPAHIEKSARHYYAQIKRKGLTKQPVRQANSIRSKDYDKDFQEVNLSGIGLEDVREIGSEWLCKQALEELHLGEHLKQSGWDETQADTALLHIISKACYPASEHKTAQWINDNSSVAELFNRSPGSINRFHLYRVSNMLYKAKDDTEEFLSVRTNELFDLKDKIVLFDLTNTFFEGRKAGSKLAKFSRSKEKRNDAKLVALALVVNVEGFVKYSKIYRGNIADCKTLKETVEDLSARTSATGRNPVIVIDAGIATDENLKMLKSNHYSYVCVSRSKLKDYQVVGQDVIHLHDKRGQSIDIQWVEKTGDDDQYLHVHSQMKALKESSMNEHFCDRYEEELDNIARSIHKKGCTKKYGKVQERIGRIKERYPAANKHYKIDVKEKDGIAVLVSWKRKPITAPNGEGVYFIRTDIRQPDEKMIWDIYNTIREIEATFRVLKTDLSLRPIFHKKDEYSEAHLYMGILAYAVVNTIRHRLKNHGIHHDWRNIVRIMNTQKAGTISMMQRDGKQVNVRVCSMPSSGAHEIYSAMRYKTMPFYRKKFVFPEK